MMNPHDALDRLQDMVQDGSLGQLCHRHGVELLVVHGSVLDPEPLRPPSDLDLAFRFRHDATGDLLALVNALLAATSCDDVDLMDLGRAGPVARARALAPTNLVLYEAEPHLFALAQMAAITEAMETRYLRRRDLQLLAGR